MNLATPTNSLMSNIMHRQVLGYTPKVKDGVTLLGWTDRHVGTIQEVIDDGHFIFTEDHTKRDMTKGEGYMGHQDWVHTECPDASKQHAVKGKDGLWRIAHQKKNGKWSTTKKSYPLAVGHRDYYHDWSF